MSAAKSTKEPANKWFDRIILFATLLTCAVALSPNPADPDLWGHVQYGRDALREGLPATTSYSFTAEGYRWINHENLAELILAIGADTVGPVGMLVAKCLMGVSLIGLIMWFARQRGCSLLSICVVALLVSVNLTYFWAMRPQLTSYFYFTMLLALLTWCFAGWEGRCRLPWFDRGPVEQASSRVPAVGSSEVSNTSGDARATEDAGAINTVDVAEQLGYSRFRMRFLWFAPLILCLWTNSHGGFAAGTCIYVAYLVFRSIEALATSGRPALGLVRRFALMAFCGVLATFINPYGPGLQLWMLESLGSPRPEILEWRPPNLLDTVMTPLWLIMFSWFAVLLLTKRSRDFTHVAIMTLTLWQSLEHVRHIPFFALPFGFWMAIHVDSVLRRFNITQTAGAVHQAMKPALRWSFAGVTVLAFGLLSFKLVTRLSDMPVDRAQYPVSAFQYMADQDLKGRMIVTYNWAQYAIAAFGPRDATDDGILVSFDGRFRTCYPQEIVDMNFDFTLGHLEPRFRGPTSPEFNDEWVLEYGQPDLVLVNRHQPHSVNVMFRNRERWTLLYQDKIAQLWGRASKYADTDSEHFIGPDQRRVTEDEQEGSVTWPALPIVREQRRNSGEPLAARSSNTRASSRDTDG